MIILAALALLVALAGSAMVVSQRRTLRTPPNGKQSFRRADCRPTRGGVRD